MSVSIAVTAFQPFAKMFHVPDLNKLVRLFSTAPIQAMQPPLSAMVIFQYLTDFQIELPHPSSKKLEDGQR